MKTYIHKDSGFTLIEILMVILLLGILSSVAIPQFINFQVEAKNTATSGNLASLRGAIANQYAQMLTRCLVPSGLYPNSLSITANNIADGNSICTSPGQVPATDVGFISGGIPNNPWGGLSTITDCVDCNPLNDDPAVLATSCNSVNFTGGWCYNPATGAIWADSALNGAGVGLYEGSL